MSPSKGSGDEGVVLAFVVIAGIFLAAIAWPWFLGTYLAVQMGADNPSTARTAVGWVLEVPWLVFLVFIPFYLMKLRSDAQERAGAEAAEQQRIAAKQEKIAAKARAEAAEREAKARAAAAEQAAARAKALERERWFEDVQLDGADLDRVTEVDGIRAQVEAENNSIEWGVRYIEEKALFSRLPVPSDIAKNSHVAGDPDGIAQYVKSALTSMPLHNGRDSFAKVAYSVDSRQLVVEYELPSIHVVPKVKWYRWIESRQRLTATARPAAQVKSLYGSLISQVSLLCIAYIFGSDTKRDVDVVVLNGVVNTIDPRSGKRVRPCLITVRVTRDTFDEIDLAHVEPIVCLKHLSASVSRSPAELAPVRPIVEFSMVDPRFISETDTLSGMDSRPNLMDLTPGEFESLIQNLFTSMGLETKQTRASRDGGVDCVAYDTRPIFGGKVVIQAKRYKNTVGVSAVRDLFGTLQNEGASKGILVTTSGYGKASFEFAQNKPIELIDGGNLLYLLEEHAGIKARIEVPDDWRDPVPDSADSAP